MPDRLNPPEFVGSSGSSRPTTPQGLFTRLAGWYDLLNFCVSLGQERRWRDAACARLRSAQRRDVVDLCCGTGGMSSAIRKAMPDASITGIDMNAEMLQVARRRRSRGYVELTRGSAESLPLSEVSADSVVIGFAFHDLGAARTAVSEIVRVLRPGGHLLVLELTTPDRPLLRGVYLAVLRGLARVRDATGLSSAGHLIDEILASPPHEHLIDQCTAGGLRFQGRRQHGFGLTTSYLFTRPDEASPRPDQA